MSTLRQRLKRPETYLFGVCAVAILGLTDSFREPPNQVTGRLYVSAVHSYQAVGRPLLAGYVQCRFRPSCSEYSVAVVQKYGIRHGFTMTVARVRSCKRSVQLGTYDPVR